MELLLCKSQMDITYMLPNEALKTQFTVITLTTSGALEFTIYCCSIVSSLAALLVLILMLLIRSLSQQFINHRDYRKFKALITKMLEDNELKENIRAFFIEGEITTTNDLKMKF